MKDAYLNSIEMISLLQHKNDECLKNLNDLEIRIIMEYDDISTVEKIRLMAMIDELKPRLNDVVEGKINAIRKKL